MMGRLVEMLKRWWKFVLVITLALSLTSCAKRTPVTGSPNYGFGYCDGNLGQFDVYVIPMSPGQYQLSIIPVSVNQGDVVNVTIANNSLGYRQLVPQVVANNEEEINAGMITDNDLTNYNILSISPYDASGTPWYQQNGQYTNMCQLPLPGTSNTAGSVPTSY